MYVYIVNELFPSLKELVTVQQFCYIQKLH